MIKDFSHEVRQLEHEARMLPKILNGIGDPVFQSQIRKVIALAVEFMPDGDAMTVFVKEAVKAADARKIITQAVEFLPDGDVMAVAIKDALAGKLPAPKGKN